MFCWRCQCVTERCTTGDEGNGQDVDMVEAALGYFFASVDEGVDDGVLAGEGLRELVAFVGKSFAKVD